MGIITGWWAWHCYRIKQLTRCFFGKHRKREEQREYIRTYCGVYFSAVEALARHPYGRVVLVKGHRFVQYHTCDFCLREIL